MSKDFAGAIYNKELRYTVREGETFNAGDRAQFLWALGRKRKPSSLAIKNSSTSVKDRIPTAFAAGPGRGRAAGQSQSHERARLPAGLEDAYRAAVEAKQNSFELNGVTYRITKERKASRISTEHDVALAMLNVYDAYNLDASKVVDSYDFKLASVRAINEGKSSFTLGDQTFSIR